MDNITNKDMIEVFEEKLYLDNIKKKENIVLRNEFFTKKLPRRILAGTNAGIFMFMMLYLPFYSKGDGNLDRKVETVSGVKIETQEYHDGCLYKTLYQPYDQDTSLYYVLEDSKQLLCKVYLNSEVTIDDNGTYKRFITEYNLKVDDLSELLKSTITDDLTDLLPIMQRVKKYEVTLENEPLTMSESVSFSYFTLNYDNAVVEFTEVSDVIKILTYIMYSLIAIGFSVSAFGIERAYEEISGIIGKGKNDKEELEKLKNEYQRKYKKYI